MSAKLQEMFNETKLYIILSSRQKILHFTVDFKAECVHVYLGEGISESLC